MKGGKEEWKKKSRVEGQEKLQNRSTYLAQEKAGKKKKKKDWAWQRAREEKGPQGMSCQPKRASKSSEERAAQVQIARGEGWGSGQKSFPPKNVKRL